MPLMQPAISAEEVTALLRGTTILVAETVTDDSAVKSLRYTPGHENPFVLYIYLGQSRARAGWRSIRSIPFATAEEAVAGYNEF